MSENATTIDMQANLIPTDAPDYSDYKVLDAVELNAEQKRTGLIRCLVCSVLAIILFFWPLNIGGNSTIMFAFIYKHLTKFVGRAGVYYALFLSLCYTLLSVYHLFCGKSLSKDHIARRYCDGEGPIRVALNICGLVFLAMYSLHIAKIGYEAPFWLMNPEIGPVVIGSIVADCVWILPLGAFFMPLLIDYGMLDFFGTFLEPVMRPLFKTPGRSALDAVGSFVSAASVGVLITNALHRNGVYTKKEAAIIATGFSAVSIGFAFVVCDTGGLGDQFPKVYGVSLAICFVVTAICARLYPLRSKPDVYFNGRQQTKEDLLRDKEMLSKKNMFSLACDRAIKKGYVANPVAVQIRESVKTAAPVLPKVYTLMSAVCVIAMVAALYSPFFEYIGKLFLPVLNLLQIPNAADIAGAFWSGIAEMFIPVLMIAGKADQLPEMARFMVVSVSMVQIIFFSDSATVMLAVKLPVTVKDLIIIFFERTIIAIFICAAVAHILY